MNYYEILKIDKYSTTKAIKKHYYSLAKKYHPDKNKGDKKYEEKLKKINQAFEEIKKQLVTKLN